MCVPIICVIFSNDAYYESYCYVSNRHFAKSLPTCCDVLDVTYHLDCTRKDLNMPWLKKSLEFLILKGNRPCTFAWV